MVSPGVAKDLIFAPEAGQREHAGEAERGDHERCVGPGHELAQAAHLAHVERVRRVVDATRAEEEQRLEEGVGKQVEDGGDIAAHAQRQHHVAELADRRIGKHTLDVDDDESKQRRDKGRRPADRGDRHPRIVRHLEDGEHAGDQIDAGHNHGSGVDQRGDRGGALHCVRQPDVEGELGRFADRASEDAQPEEGEDVDAGQAGHRQPLYLGDVKRACLHPDQDDRQH